MQSFPKSHSLLCSIKKCYLYAKCKRRIPTLRPFNYVCIHIWKDRQLSKKKKKSSHFHLVEQSFNTYVHNSWILPEASCDQSLSFTVHCKVHWGEMFIKKRFRDYSVSAGAGLMFKASRSPHSPHWWPASAACGAPRRSHTLGGTAG